MTVDRSYQDHETIYRLRNGAGSPCTLIFDARPDARAGWKILMPGPGGTSDLYGTEEFAAPDAGQLRAWLTPIVGADRAAELTGAVDAQPPHQAAWRRQAPGMPGSAATPGSSAAPGTEGRNP